MQGVDEKPAVAVWGFFIPACLQEPTYTLYLDALCLVIGETEIAFFPDSRKVCFGSSLSSKVGMNTQVVNFM